MEFENHEELELWQRVLLAEFNRSGTVTAVSADAAVTLQRERTPKPHGAPSWPKRGTFKSGGGN